MLRLYDTPSKSVRDVVPAIPGLLTVYACGPTVYRFAHVGNMRTFLLTDLIRRAAQRHRLRVEIVQNITDVGHLQHDDVEAGEDKMSLAAQRERKDPWEIARFYEEAFHRDQALLGVKPADAYPRASESIDLMLSLISRLIELDHAYVGTDGTVYFDARSFEGYGAISGNKLEDLRAGHREDADALTAGKRFHADWALWKRAGAAREMTWDSPWGFGFPGWHIECSAMSLDLLGDRFDLHTGGIDLRFPHHEDERAQSNCAVGGGTEVVGHWTHGEHLLFEGRKMAKSTGNVVLVSDVVERGFDPLALRLAFLSTRHRQQANLSWESIAAADALLIATPEYNHCVPGVLKNAVDWASRPPRNSVLTGKPVGVMGASTGGGGTARAQAHLRDGLAYTNGLVLPLPEVLVSRAAQKFDAQSNLTDAETREEVRDLLKALAAWVRRLQASAGEAVAS